MNTPIVVTGGTGALGREVVARLLAGGQAVRVLSRRPAPADLPPGLEWATADLSSGDGVDVAVDGTVVVIHCATSGRRRLEVAAARRLAEAARLVGCRHLLFVSIVGVDRVPLPYYQGKLAAERVIEQGAVPATILRATQFHDLLRVLFAAGARLPVMPVPALRVQPVHVDDVAARLVELAAGVPLGRAPDLGGPEVRSAVEVACGYLRAIDRRRAVVPVRLPGRTFRAFAGGGHLAPDHATGRTTFEEFLARHPAPAGLGYRSGVRR